MSFNSNLSLKPEKITSRERKEVFFFTFNKILLKTLRTSFRSSRGVGCMFGGGGGSHDYQINKFIYVGGWVGTVNQQGT